MILVKATRSDLEDPTKLTGLAITVTGDSIEHFTKMVARALNVWDFAPQEIKEFGDMVTEGRLLQEYDPKKNPSHTNPGHIPVFELGTPEEEAAAKRELGERFDKAIYDYLKPKK